MPECPDCGCDLPSLQTLCSKCYDARYADVVRSKSIPESIWQFGSNPRREQVREERIKAQPWWLAWAFAAIGLALDWRCAFEWFAGKSAFYSEIVLGRTVLIVLACAGVSLLLVCIVRAARWRDALLPFSVFSMAVYRVLSNHWIATRR
jgi:hypothetical protein